MGRKVKPADHLRDPFGLLTTSMVLFNEGLQDWYDSKDGYRHSLDGSKTQMTTKCLGCGANRTDRYTETPQTQDDEAVAFEVADWQINHRKACHIPSLKEDKAN